MKWLVAAQALLSVSFCSAFELRPPPVAPRELSTNLEATTLSMNEASLSPGLTESKVGVLLLNLGGPETGDDVEGQ